MMNQEANIDIIRKDGKLASISVVMPIWDKQGMDDVLAVEIPLLGMKTYAKDDCDADKAVKESIELFCINAEKNGKGLENELKLLGWGFAKSTDINTVSMTFSTNSIIYDRIMQTGDRVLHKLDL